MSSSKLILTFVVAAALAAVVPAAAQTSAPAQGSAPAAVAASESSLGLAASVNQTIISNYDLDQRTALFVATSGIHPSKDELPQLRAQVLRSLEDETLEMQEAEKRRISASPAEVEKALQGIATDNKISSEQLLATIGQSGVTPATFVNQLRAQIVWQKLVAARYGADVHISDQQVEDALARIKEGADKPQFLVSEIYLAVDKPEDETSVRAAAERIAQQTMQGVGFQTVASQFSQSPSAATGGDIGWVLEGQLPDEVDHALLGLQPGQIAGPIRAEGGYYILQLRDRREPAGSVAATPAAATPADPNAPVALGRFLIPLPKTTDASLKDRAMTMATVVQGRVHVCSDLSDMAKQLTGTVYESLGTVKPADLDPAIRDALAKSTAGEAMNPFISGAGVEVIMRCDAPAPKIGVFQMPTRDQVQQQLAMQQMSVYAKAYLAELRRNAVVFSSIK
ncbi:MAG TPA: peptidylprolyl isomerase [Micropepsaceae bacterium]|nr:peptidylprolyl isomerase [Micropepsaceae bacterium]